MTRQEYQKQKLAYHVQKLEYHLGRLGYSLQTIQIKQGTDATLESERVTASLAKLSTAGHP